MSKLTEVLSLNDFATVVGWLFMFLATLACGAFAAAWFLEKIVRNVTSVWWIALFAIHHKAFRKWCKEEAKLPELHQRLVDGESLSAPPARDAN